MEEGFFQSIFKQKNWIKDWDAFDVPTTAGFYDGLNSQGRAGANFKIKLMSNGLKRFLKP